MLISFTWNSFSVFSISRSIKLVDIDEAMNAIAMNRTNNVFIFLEFLEFFSVYVMI